MKSVFGVVLVVLLLGRFVLADDHLHESPEDGFISIFDGKTLQGWDGNPKFWSVQDGAITGITTEENPTKGNTFIIWRGGTVDDFELRLKFKIIGGNSGIQYRSEDKGNWVVGGYQGDFESKETYSGILYEERGRGILAQRGQMTQVSSDNGKTKIDVIASLGKSEDIQAVIKKEDWNDYKIIAHANHFLHVINGRATCQVVDLDHEKGAKSGILAFQLHAGPPMKVQFKDVRIKPLKGIDVAGDWVFDVRFAGGGGSPTFHFQTEGTQLIGKYDGAFGQQKVSGKLDGGNIRFTFPGEYSGQDVECLYTGKVSGFGKMSGSVVINEEYEGTWTARRK